MSVDTLFIGIGSSHGDDRIGWLVADELQSIASADLIVRHAKSPLDLLDWLGEIRCLAICDACRGMGPVGSWHRSTWPIRDVPVVRPAGSHSLGLVDTLQLASRLDLLPEEVLLWSVEIAGDRPVAQITTEVAAAISPVANDVASVLRLRQPASTFVDHH